MTSSAFDVVLFDIDNVLIDTRASYLAAIQKTVERYLNRPGVVSEKDVNQFKLLGGFNDDWDCAYGMIVFLETAIQGKPVRFGDHRRQRLSICELPALFPERPLGLEGLIKRLRILYERVEEPSYRKITRLFQRIYWGEGRKPTGLIRRERLVFSKPLLERIRNRGVRIGIVTGRNRLEAVYALKRFGIFRFFEVLVTIDLVRREEKKQGRLLRKPDPWPLLEAARRFQKKGRPAKRFLYVGDLPDDILAARRARKKLRIRSAAFPILNARAKSAGTYYEELKKTNPDFILKKPGDILKILFP